MQAENFRSLSFFPVEAKRFKRWTIAHGKKNGALGRGPIFVPVPLERWHEKTVSFLPLKSCAVDPCSALSLDDVIHRHARVAVLPRFYRCFQELYLSAHSRRGASAGHGVRIIEQDTVVGIRFRRLREIV